MRTRGAPGAWSTPGDAARSARFALVAIVASTAACMHDFSIFEPSTAAPSDAGTSAPTGSEEGGADVSVASGDGATGPAPDAASYGDGSPSCGSDCRIEATSCAGTCAEDEQSCAAGCTGADAGCTPACLATETSCTSECVTMCETCTSGEGCVDPKGCGAAAP